MSQQPTPYYADDYVTLYHGDCREITGWLDGDVMVTDPPYGMALRSRRVGAFGASVIAGDDTTETRDAALGLWGDRPALVFGRWSIPRPGGTRHVLIWEKGEHVGMGDLALPWKPNTEEVYVLGNGFTGHRGSSVLRHLAVAGTVGRADQGTRHHPTEKPLGVMRELIGKCPPGVIVDPFTGSGSTLRAAKDLGRRAIGVELSERYCEIAAERLGQEVLDFGGVA
jgi:DNA modification methylase